MWPKNWGCYDPYRRWWICPGKNCTDVRCACKLENTPPQRTPEYRKQKHVLPKLRAVR